MKINDRPFLFSYRNDNQGDGHVFVINADKSDKTKVQMYDHFVNGLHVGDSYSITEIYRLMDNGYKWTTV